MVTAGAPNVAVARPTQGTTPIHLPALDLVRLLAMGGVIAIHAVAWAGRDTPAAALWYRVLDFLVRCSVPCFVLMTGVLLSHTSGGRRPAALFFLRRRLERIGLPWLVWATVWS